MKTLKEIYYHVNGDKPTSFVKAEVYYDKGGYSFLTGKRCQCAYWMSCYKMERGEGWESYTIFGNDGCKKLLHEVGRQSKKWDNLSLEDFDKNIDDFVKHVYPDLSLIKESEVA